MLKKCISMRDARARRQRIGVIYFEETSDERKKKRLVVVLFLSAFLATLLVFVFWPATARADALKGDPFTDGNADAATVKPKITVERKEITLDEAKANNKQTIKILVSDTDDCYSSTGIWVQYDSMLTVS